MAEIEKLDIQSMNIKQEQIDKLKTLFPEIFTEGNKIDWERLKLTLGEDIDTGKERYGMNWPGKADCYKTIQQPSIATLLPCPEESLKPDGTPYAQGEGFSNHVNHENPINHGSDNLFIEGDNLEVLKLLQKSYLGKIKMIYIDPPYNTGKDFIYPDNYSENLQTYLEYTGQVDNEGRKFGTNTDTDGRFHSKWMNMMYPRLFLAKNLLREDGVIFISIDDNEVHNLRALCNEIFGEENFLANVVWQRTYAPISMKKYFSESHEHLLIYSKHKEHFNLNLLPRTEKQNKDYKNPDEDPRGVWKGGNLTVGPAVEKQVYEIIGPTGKSFYPPKGYCWRFTKEKFEELKKDNRIWFGVDGNNSPLPKLFLTEVQDGITPMTLWTYQEVGHNQESTRELRAIFDESVFTNPKPVRYIARTLQLGSNDNDIILDFFAGSGTTAHAVLDLNKEDGGNRKFICVQIPQPTETDSEAAKAGYKNIADIGKERIRRVSKRIAFEIENEKAKKEQAAKNARQNPTIFDSENQVNQKNPINHSSDIGFKVFKLAPSNFKIWDSNIEKTPEAVQLAMQLHTENIVQTQHAASQQEALLYEILLKAGFELATPIEKLNIEGKAVYSVSEGQLLICLEKEITHELIKAIAESRPVRVVCLDEGFRNNDQLKTNAVQIMKSKGVVKFQTV